MRGRQGTGDAAGAWLTQPRRGESIVAPGNALGYVVSPIEKEIIS